MQQQDRKEIDKAQFDIQAVHALGYKLYMTSLELGPGSIAASLRAYEQTKLVTYSVKYTIEISEDGQATGKRYHGEPGQALKERELNTQELQALAIALKALVILSRRWPLEAREYKTQLATIVDSYMAAP